MTIRHLKIFIAVAETGQMSKAAKSCYLTQPTVSQAIRELEEHYGTLLFERLSKRLHITLSGQKLLIHAQKLLSEYTHLEESMRGESRKKQLRIGATMTIGTCLLPKLLNTLEQELPGLLPSSFIANTSIVEKQLLDGSLDIALVEGTLTNSDLISVPAIDDYLVLACSKDHPLAKKDTITLDELSNHRFVIREKGSGTRSLFEHYATQKHLRLQIACESNSTEAIKNAVIENHYLAVISARLVAKEAEAGVMYLYQSQHQYLNRHFYLVYHKDKEFTEEMSVLQQMVVDNNYPIFSKDVQMRLLLD